MASYTGIVGPIVGAIAGRRDNNFRASQARQANAFSAEMASTQYQRSVEDMKAAGINPMLAIDQGGNASPVGQQASVDSSYVGPLVSSTMQAMRWDKDLDVLIQQAQNLYWDSEKKSGELNVALEDAKVKRQMQENIGAITDGVKLDNMLKGYSLAGAKNVSDVQKSDFGGIMKYVRELTDSLGFRSSAGANIQYK